MNALELMQSRRSVRTFDGRPLTDEHLEKLRAFVRTIKNPYDIPVEFFFLDKAANGLSSPVISGETMYAAAKVKNVPHSEEAFGYAFEQMILYARYLGIGTTLIGGTMNREAFETAVLRESDERMYLVTPLGYPADKMSLKETAMRTAIRADKRKPFDELFFENDFSAPLETDDEAIREALEAVRLIAGNIETAVSDGRDLAARTAMAFASNIAGIAFAESSVHAGHAIAHETGVVLEQPHGLICALVTPVVIEYSAPCFPERMVALAEALGVTDATPETAGAKAAEAVRALARELGIPSLKSMGIRREDVVACAAGAVEHNIFINTAPKPTGVPEVAELLGQMYDTY